VAGEVGFFQIEMLATWRYFNFFRSIGSSEMGSNDNESNHYFHILVTVFKLLVISSMISDGTREEEVTSTMILYKRNGGLVIHEVKIHSPPT